MGILIIALLFLLPSFAFADTYPAADCTHESVQAAITSAADGDTVTIPAGSCTWDAVVTVPTTKGLIIQGNGISSTIITISLASYRSALSIATTTGRQPIRVTGIRFERTTGYAAINIYGTATNFRIDNNYFNATGISVAVGNTNDSTGQTYGVIDSNIMVDCRPVIIGTRTTTSPAIDDTAWTTATGFGGADFVYIEGNTISATTHMNAVDANASARYVFRFNTVTDAYLEGHSGCVYGIRSIRAFEAYNNLIKQESRGMYSAMLLRGGTGLIYDNKVTGTWSSYGAQLDDIASCTSQACGTHTPSSGYNTTFNGVTKPSCTTYPCQDQIGRGVDTGFGTSQALEPWFGWGNSNGAGTEFNLIQNPAMCAAGKANVVENRDFYNATDIADAKSKGLAGGYAMYTCPHPLTGYTSGTCNTSSWGAGAYTETSPTEYLLSVVRVGSGTVTSSPVGIDCGSTCGYAYTGSPEVTLTATAQDVGWKSAIITGDCSGSGVVTVSANKSCTVTFDKNTNQTLGSGAAQTIGSGAAHALY